MGKGNFMIFSASDYRRMLDEGFLNCQDNQASRLEYLSDYIFDFTTYDSEMAELFASKAIEVCKAISGNTTFEYIKNKDNYPWYLLMCNIPFFANRIEWGTSIRGAWWDGGSAIQFDSCGLWLDGDQIIETITFNQNQWIGFIDAVVDFGSSQMCN